MHHHYLPIFQSSSSLSSSFPSSLWFISLVVCLLSKPFLPLSHHLIIRSVRSLIYTHSMLPACLPASYVHEKPVLLSPPPPPLHSAPLQIHSILRRSILFHHLFLFGRRAARFIPFQPNLPFFTTKSSSFLLLLRPTLERMMKQSLLWTDSYLKSTVAVEPSQSETLKLPTKEPRKRISSSSTSLIRHDILEPAFTLSYCCLALPGYSSGGQSDKLKRYERDSIQQAKNKQQWNLWSSIRLAVV